MLLNSPLLRTKISHGIARSNVHPLHERAFPIDDANSKGASNGYVITVDGNMAMKAATLGVEMYVTAVEYDDKDSLKLAKYMTASPPHFQSDMKASQRQIKSGF